MPDSSAFPDAGVPEVETASNVAETVNISHELDNYGYSDSFTQVVHVPPSDDASVVVVESQVVPTALAGMKSPTYMASVRRRLARSIADLFEGLRANALRDDFEVFTFPVFEKIRKAIEQLQTAETEGNSREILRQLRDSIMDGRWNSYRSASSVNTAIEVLALLQADGAVAADAVAVASSTLRSSGLTPVSLAAFDVYEETPTE